MKKRVLFFSHYPTRFGLDGANKILMLTATEMPGSKYEKLMLLQSHGAVSEYLDKHGMNYKIMNYDCERFNILIYGDNDKNDFEGICRSMENAVKESQLFQFVKEWKPDIMYVNSCMAIVGAICGKLAEAKVLWHIHDIPTGILSEADHNNLNRVIAKYADKIVAVSQAVKDALHETGKLDNTELIYIGVENPGYSQQELYGMNLSIRKSLGIKEQTPVIAYLAIHGAIMGKLAGAKVFWHVHDIGESFLSQENCRDLNRIINRYADKIVGVSKAVQRAVGIAGRFPKFEVVYNGVKPPGLSEQDLEEARIRIRYGFGIGAADPVIAYLGQFQRFKGLHHFVSCASLVRHKIQNARFLIIGDPNKDPAYAEELMEQVKSAKMESQLQFTGYYRNLNDILPAVDCLVVPSAFEDPLPTVVIEGNLYKIPVVAFNRGGIGEIIINGKNGFLIEKDNIGQMADAIVRIFRNPYMGMDMAEFGYKRSLNKFGYQRFIDNMEEILLEVAEGNYAGKPCRNGGLIQGSGPEVYWLINGEKHHVASYQVLHSLGFDVQDIQPVNDEVLKLIP